MQISNLPAGITADQAVNLLEQVCGKVTSSSFANSSASLHFEASEARQLVLDLNGTELLAGSGERVVVTGSVKKYSSHPTDVLKAHSMTWSSHWHTHNIRKVQEVIATMRKQIDVGRQSSFV